MAKLSVEQALAKAKSHIKKGEVADAQALYATILEIFPNNKKAQKGMASLGVGQSSAAEHGLPQAVIDQLMTLYDQGQLDLVSQRAQNLTIQFPRAVVLWNILGASYGKLGKFDQAICAFEKIVFLNPNQASAHYNLGNVLKDQGKLEEAINSYVKALEIKPNYEAALNNMKALLSNVDNANDQFKIAFELQTQGKLDEAISAYTKSITMWPSYVEALSNMGVVLQDQGKLEEAMEVYNKILAINPDYAEVHNNIGITFKDQGKLEEAIDAHKKALTIKPDYAEAYYNMGIVLKDQGNLEEAIESYKKALNLKPDYFEAYNNMGLALKDQGKLEDAIGAYTTSISLWSDYADAYVNMGVALNDLRRSQEAVQAYKKALNLKPDYFEAYNNMGVALKDQGKLEEAIEAYKKALILKPDYAAAFNNMGIVLKDQDELEKAVEAFKKALSIEPDFADAARNLIKIPLGRIDSELIEQLSSAQEFLCANIKNPSERLFFKANILAHNGKLNDAFELMVEANRIKWQQVSSNAKHYERHCDMAIELARNWTPELKPIHGSTLKKLFVLGPSRSGKSTLENILMSNPNIFPMFENINLNLLSNFNNTEGVHEVLEIDQLFYHEERDLLRGGYDMVTSTSPANIFEVDRLMDRVVNCFVVLVKRNRADIAAEIFTKEYRSGNFYAYDNSSILTYLLKYDAMWKIVKQKVRNRTLEVSFDDILTKPQEVLESISKLTSVVCTAEFTSNPSVKNLEAPFKRYYQKHFEVNNME